MSRHAHHEHDSPEFRRHDQAHQESAPKEHTDSVQPEGATQPGSEAVAAASQPSAEASAAGAASGDTLEARLEAANDQIAHLKAEHEELKDKYMRILAEQVNFRKRMAREKEEAQKYAVSALLVDLVGVLDDFDRSLEAARSATDTGKVVEGVEMIRKRLSNLLENKYGLKRFTSKGQVFDPNLHEAMFATTGNVAEPVVEEEFMPGYMLHDRVVRSAKVKVTMPAPSAPTDSVPAQDESQTGQTREGQTSVDAEPSGSPGNAGA